MNATNPSNHPSRLPSLSVIHLSLTAAFVIFPVPWDAHRQWLALLTLIAILGLPHGALDPLLAYRSGLWKTLPGAVALIVAYLALAASMLWFWQRHTAIALALFLIITAWHFSGDWRYRGYPLVGWASAALLLGLPALAHPQELIALFALLLGFETARLFQIGLAVLGVLALPLALATALRAIRHAPDHALELAAIGLGGFALPPLWFFALYFCVLHSPRHLARHFAATARGAPRTLLAVGVVFSLPVIVAAVWHIFDTVQPRMSEAFARILFAGLFALTVPHLLLVEWVENRAPGS